MVWTKLDVNLHAQGRQWHCVHTSISYTIHLNEDNKELMPSFHFIKYYLKQDIECEKNFIMHRFFFCNTVYSNRNLLYNKKTIDMGKIVDQVYFLLLTMSAELKWIFWCCKLRVCLFVFVCYFGRESGIQHLKIIIYNVLC